MRSPLQRINERRRPPTERRRSHPAARRPAEADPERRVREAGGPEDTALFSCGCGYAFQAAVTTTVACPHCSAEQAW